MASHQSPRYDSPSDRSYRQRLPEDAQSSSKTASSNERPRYQPAPKVSDGRYGLQSGTSRQFGGMGRYGREGHNEIRSQSAGPRQNDMRVRNGDMRRPPGQQRPIDPERRGYVDPRARGQARTSHAPPRNDFGAARDDQPQHRNLSKQHEMQRSLPVEPVFSDEPEEISGSNYSKGKGYNDSQDYQPSPKLYSDSSSAMRPYRSERAAFDDQHQDYGEAYRQEISHGNNNHAQGNMHAVATQSRFMNDQIYTRPASNRVRLDGSMASMNLNEDRRPEKRDGMHQGDSPIDAGRRSEDSKAGPAFSPNGSDAGRSRTMPSKISEAFQNVGPKQGYLDRPAWQEHHGHNAGYHRAQSTDHFSSRTNEDAQPRLTGHSGSHLDETGMAHAHEEPNFGPTRPTHSAQNSLGDFYDSYYDTSQHDQQHEKDQQPNSPDEEMPNFDAVPHTNISSYSQGMSIDDHLLPPKSVPGPSHSVPQYHRGNSDSSRPNAHVAGQVSRSKSQPNLKNQRSPNYQRHGEFVFDFSGDAPPVPPVTPSKDNRRPSNFVYPPPRSQSRNEGVSVRHKQRSIPPFYGQNGGAELNEMGHQGQQPYERYRSPPPPNGFARGGWGMRPGTPGSRPSTGNAIGPHSPRVNYPEHPDALPPHPVPVRPGLLQGPSAQRPEKPPPIRQYTSSPSPSQHPIPPPPPEDPLPPGTKRDSVPVTLAELERLRQTTKSRPSDQNAQLALAKKLAEASVVLVDDSGRTDQKAKNKARERYNQDAYRIVKKLVNSNYTEAFFYLGDCYSRGLIGLELDPKEAFNLYISAAKAGHAQSAYRVAVCCELGQEEGGGTKRDPQKAMQWYKRAATLGDTPAMYKIGIIKLKGLLGQPKDAPEALIWLKRAADRADEENPHALHELVSSLELAFSFWNLMRF